MLHNIIRTIRAIKWRTLDFLSTEYYRIVCKNFGKNSRVAWGTWLDRPHQISIEDNVQIGRNVQVGSEIGSSTICIGSGVVINKDVTIDFTGNVEIHKNCFISENVYIYTHTHGRDPRSKPTGSKLVIGECSWIGAYSIILSRCNSIGPNSIIAIRSLVTKDVPAEKIFKNQI